MTEDLGGISGSREPNPQAVSALTGFDPGRMLAIMADLEAALVLTAEHNPTASVCSFVDSSIQFRNLADFLHANQHMEVPE